MSQEDEDFSENEAILLLNDAWRTEVNAPEILPYKEELISEVTKMLTHQMESVDARREELEKIEMQIMMYEMDIERIRYSVARYLRTRLLKVERDLDYIASNIDAMDRLSSAEKDFASKLNAINNSAMEESVLKRLNLGRDSDSNQETSRELFETRSISNRVQNAQPYLQNFVFCEALENINVFIKEKQMDFYHKEGNISILRYSAIKENVTDDTIKLL